MFASTRFGRRLTPVLLLFLVAALGIGCGVFSPDESKPPDNGGGGGGTFGAATTPDTLMANFKNAWEQRSIVEYEKLLDDQFQFFFDPNDGLDSFIGPSWGRQNELDSVGAMFRGDTGFDLITHEAIPPILSIEFTTFAKIIDWSDPGTDPLYEGTLKARYKVGIKVQFQGVEQYTLVTGDNDFYVIKVPQTDGPDIYKIKVWEDQGQDVGA
jgi:hypothetical protein